MVASALAAEAVSYDEVELTGPGHVIATPAPIRPSPLAMRIVREPMKCRPWASLPTPGRHLSLAMNAERLSGRAGATRPGEGKRDPVSLTVDISLTQIALIAAETAPLVRRFFPNSDSMQNLAEGVERFLSARADTLEARMYAEEVVRAWRRVADTPEQRELLLVHRKLRGIGRQDRVVERLRRLETALASTAPPAPRRRPSRRKTLAG